MAHPKLSLNSLSGELIIHILNLVRMSNWFLTCWRANICKLHTTSPSSVLNAVYLSKRFHNLSTDILYRNLVINFGVSRLSANLRLFKILSDHDALCDKVWQVCVTELVDQRTIQAYHPIYDSTGRYLGTEVLPRYDKQMADHVDALASILPRLSRLKCFRYVQKPTLLILQLMSLLDGMWIPQFH
jgi:hypothetical protein